MRHAGGVDKVFRSQVGPVMLAFMRPLAFARRRVTLAGDAVRSGIHGETE